MTRIAAILVAMTVASAASAGPLDRSWVPAEAVCDVGDFELEVTRKADANECRTLATSKNSIGLQRVSIPVLNQCMDQRGWEPASAVTAELYGRFCRIVRRLSSTDDDPEVVATVPRKS